MVDGNQADLPTAVLKPSILASYPHTHTCLTPSVKGAASCADGSHIRVKNILAYRVLLSVCRRGDGGPENRTKRKRRPASMPNEGWVLVLSSFSRRGVRTDRSWVLGERRTWPRWVVIGLKCWISGESDNSHGSKRIPRVRMARPDEWRVGERGGTAPIPNRGAWVGTLFALFALFHANRAWPGGLNADVWSFFFPFWAL